MAVPSHNDLVNELLGFDGESTVEEVAKELLDAQDPTYVSTRAREILFKTFRRRGKPLGARYQETWDQILTRPGERDQFDCKGRTEHRERAFASFA